MKSIGIMNIVFLAMAISFARVSCVSDKGSMIANNTYQMRTKCPAGSKWDVSLDRCVQVCAPSSDYNDTLAKCKEINPADMYGHESDDVVDQVLRPDEPIVDFQLPACKNITLQPDEFRISEDGSSLTVTVGTVLVAITEFRLSDEMNANETTADVCYPLSPQLLQCPLRKLHRPSYTVLLGRTLLSRWTNDTIGFRDYYTSPETDDIVLACNGSVNNMRKLRCNYIIYEPDEYRFLEDGRRLLLLPTNTSIYRPKYDDVGNGTINVCYPSSLPFTQCGLWKLEKHEFQIQQDHTLLDTAHNRVYDMSDYLIVNGGGAVCLVSPDYLQSTLDVYYIHAVLYLVSAVCLCVAFVVHLLVPSLNYHAKPLLCHMICMTVMYTALAIRKFTQNVDPNVCYTLFVATYYSAMASFFWLNVLSFDLWTIFANLQTTSGWLSCSCRAGNPKRRFYYYSVYALGLPLLFCAAAIVVDNNPQLQNDLSLHPKIPAMCWFNERRAAYAFLYIPMITVLVVNLALFVSTVLNLRQASRGAEVVNKKLNKQLLIVCFKLFIIMGFCWVGEAVAWTADGNIAAFYVPDAINAIQGIIIFLIYICKPATYRLLRNRFCVKKDSDGKWTMDFNTSRGWSQKTTSSGVSDRDNSIRSDVTRLSSEKSSSSRPSMNEKNRDSISLRNTSERVSEPTVITVPVTDTADSINSELPTTSV